MGVNSTGGSLDISLYFLSKVMFDTEEGKYQFWKMNFFF
jgi:hypothetical protein